MCLLGTISAPTTILWGDSDPDFPVSVAEAMADAIPTAELELVEGASHHVQVDNSEAVAATILSVSVS